MARVKGRSDDMLVIKGVNLYPSEVEATLLAIEELLPHYQLVVDRRATLAALPVGVEPARALVGGSGGCAAPHPPSRRPPPPVAAGARAGRRRRLPQHDRSPPMVH